MPTEPQENPTNLERDLGLRKPKMSRGEPWIGGELDRKGEILGAYPGTGSSLPQDIGADGFEVEPLADEPRDDLSAIDTGKEDVSSADEFDATALDWTPSIDGREADLMTVRPDRPSRVDRIDDRETPHDQGETDRMVYSSELGEMPIGAEDISPGELARYDCPNCGFEYDVVVGTAARCPRCQYEADLTNTAGDEAFHSTFSATELDE